MYFVDVADTLIGPFASEGEASQYAGARHTGDWRVREVVAPEKSKRDARQERDY